MTIKPIRTVNSYKLPDGRVFEHRKEAEYEQAMADFSTLLDDCLPETICTDTVYAVLMLDSSDFAFALKKVEDARVRWDLQQAKLRRAGHPSTVTDQERADAATLTAELNALEHDPMAKDAA